MGCVSSKLLAKEINQEKKKDYIHHVVSLTSSTYGVLKLDKERERKEEVEVKQSTLVPSPSREDPPEIINAWELMEGLEEVKRSPKSRIFDGRSPFKLLNIQMGSPRKVKKVGGKENKGRVRSLENSPNPVLKESNNNFKKPSPRLWASINGKRSESQRFDSLPTSRRSLGPSLGGNAPAPDREAILEQYERKCPPGGEDAVVIYTTTLRGIRKTFEECNVARSIIESQNVRMFERDVSMHSAFKEELRVLVDSKEVKVPLVFVKGRLIGGAEEMVKLDEEGRLGILLSGIPKAAAGGCGCCGGIRFVMCTECSGSCKVRVGDDGKKSVKCGKCNENGLIQCPVCLIL